MTKNAKNALLGAILTLQLLFCFFPTVYRIYDGETSSALVIIEDSMDTKYDSDIRSDSDENTVKNQCFALSLVNILFIADAAVTLVVGCMFLRDATAYGAFMLMSSVMLGILPMINMSMLSALFDSLGKTNDFSITGIGFVQLMVGIVSVFVAMIHTTEVKSGSPYYINRSDENSTLNRFINGDKNLK